MAGKATILLVEDDVGDAYFLKRVLDRVLANCALSIVSSHDEAVQYLVGEGKYADRVAHGMPSLILLDLWLAERSGLDFLQWLKGHPQHRVIPVVVYTQDVDPADLRRAYEMGANAVIRKRLSFDAALATMKTTARFWLEECQLVRE